MVFDQTRNDIWLGLWDAKRMGRYYFAVHQRYQRLDTGLTRVLLLAGTASVFTLWEMMPRYLQPILGAVIAAAAVWSALGHYSAKAAAAHSISVQCDDLAIEWRTLLADVDGNRIDDVAARTELDRLDRKLGHITSRCGDAGLATINKLNEKSAKEASKELEHSYA